jgi:hypothetical protein
MIFPENHALLPKDYDDLTVPGLELGEASVSGLGAT